MDVSPDNFSACIAHCKSVKVQYGRLFGLVPQQFSIRRDGSEIFFLAPEAMIGNSLYAVKVADEDQGQHPWEKVLSPSAPRQLTRSEQLLRERMRASGSGITYYEYIDTLDSIIVNSGSGCCLFPCRQHDESQVPNVITYPSLVGALDYKLCPCDKNVLGCVSDGNIWILTSYYDNPIQLTNTKGQFPLRKVMAGQSNFILQEEFDRYTGYWWDPTTERQDNTYRILYEEVDETDVEILRTFNPSKQEIEEYSYPRPGGKNAISTLKLLEFNLESQEPSTQVLSLAPSIASYLSQWEYMTRIGWTPDGNYIWVQVITREQQLMCLVLISKEAFIKEGENRSVPAPILLWKETSSSWINIKNTSYFKFLMSPNSQSMKLFIVSEQSSFPHIVFLQGDLPLPSPASTPTAMAVPANLIAQTVTLGEWNVLESKVWVDVNQSIVYFEGNKSSCLDRHLYAVNLTGELPSTDPIQLTPSGFYHSVEINVEKNIFVSSYSSQATPPAVAVYSLSHNPLQTQVLFHIWTPLELPIDFTPPTNFTTQASTGETLHGVVYPPYQLEEGKQYPTILFVYGGPEFQIVKNEFSRFMMKIAQWIRAGFAVVMLDNRGSFNRGCKFESYIKYHMGNVEVEDQVAGLQAAGQTVPYLDLTRVAIVGWSYGGYMALLSIAKKSDVFKLAVAGAPVTDLLWYDTGYTERYLGVPPSSLPAYKRSSVLPLVPSFPNEPGRVLIIHGMNDENVLYTHTSLLLDALILHGKPYSVQLFTGERHGIRNPASSNHCDATVLAYFLKYL